MREATIRKQWVAGELAALRVPDLTLLREPEPAPTFAEAAKRWQASRVDVAEATQVQHRTAEPCARDHRHAAHRRDRAAGRRRPRRRATRQRQGARVDP
jgi:hypothetical protein